MGLPWYWTTDIVKTMPYIEGGRYEIIDGELFGTTVPHIDHQRVVTIFAQEFYVWDNKRDIGLCISAPGLSFAKNQAVAPDLIWVRKDRLADILGDNGHFYAAPDLVIEVVSPGQVSSGRDRELKLSLYNRYNVSEYWIADWQARTH